MAHSNPLNTFARPFAAVLLLLVQEPLAQGSRISGPRTPGEDGGDVIDLCHVPGSGRVLYRAEGHLLDTFELYSVPESGGVAVRLNPPLPEGGAVAADHVVSPDGQSVYFRADAEALGQWNLYVSAIDGSGTPVRLNDALAPGETVAFFDVTPDGGRVVYTAGLDAQFDYILYSAPADGSASPVGLAGLGPFARVLAFELVPGSQHAVFFGLAPGSYQIAVVGLDGAAFSEPLTGAITSGLHFELGLGLDNVVLAPDGNTVVLNAALETPDVFELFHVEIMNPTVRTRITGPMTPGGDVRSLELSPDGARVLYTADQLSDETVELFSVPPDGSQLPTRLNDPNTAPGTLVTDFEIRDDSQAVLYRCSPTAATIHLEAAPIAGGAPPTRLSGSLEYVCGPYAFTPDGLGAIFLGRLDSAQHTELYTVPLDLSQPPLLLSPGLPASSNADAFVIAGPDVVYRADFTPGQRELLSVPRDGSGTSTTLNAPAPDDAEVLAGFASANGRTFFLADALQLGRFELFEVPTDASSAPTRLNGPLVAPPPPGEIPEILIP